MALQRVRALAQISRGGLGHRDVVATGGTFTATEEEVRELMKISPAPILVLGPVEAEAEPPQPPAAEPVQPPIAVERDREPVEEEQTAPAVSRRPGRA